MKECVFCGMNGRTWYTTMFMQDDKVGYIVRPARLR